MRTRKQLEFIIALIIVSHFTAFAVGVIVGAIFAK